MKTLPAAGKALSVIFAVTWMIGCASTDTADQTATESASAIEAEQVASEQAAAKAAMAKAAMAKAAKEAMAALDTVFYFDFDQSMLSAETRAALDGQVAHLKTTTSSIRLEGHADERGTREYNVALGERRANAVSGYLIGNGIPSYRIEVVSYGEERAANYGTGDPAWSKNRRVELK